MGRSYEFSFNEPFDLKALEKDDLFWREVGVVMDDELSDDELIKLRDQTEYPIVKRLIEEVLTERGLK
jgi:hypothetical protein